MAEAPWPMTPSIVSSCRRMVGMNVWLSLTMSAAMIFARSEATDKPHEESQADMKDDVQEDAVMRLCASQPCSSGLEARLPDRASVHEVTGPESPELA